MRSNHLAGRTSLALVSQVRSTGEGSASGTGPSGGADLANEVVGHRTVAHSCRKSLKFKVNAPNSLVGDRSYQR